MQRERPHKRIRTRKNITTDGRTADGFANFTARLGYGAENQISQGFYMLGNFVSRKRQELEAAYRGNWMIGAVVDCIAEDMTKKPPEMVCDFTPDDISRLNKEIGRLNIFHDLCNTIKWARLFGGGLAVMMIDGQNLSTPLRIETIRPGQFRGLLVLDRWLVNPPMNDLVTDFGPDYGMPRFYDIIGDAAVLPNARVHHSRVIRFDGIELPYYQKRFENMWGESVVERMYDRLIAFDSITHGAAQLVFKAHLRGIGVKGLREALSIGGKAEESVIKMFDYIRLMQSNEGLTLLDSEDEFWTHQYTFAGLSDMLIQAGQQVAGACGIPMVRLFGMSPAGLNATGESDLRNYYDRINKDQATYLLPAIERKLYPVLSMSALGKPLPDDFDLVFPSLWQMTDKERVDMAKAVGEAVAAARNAGLVADRRRSRS
jgi:phage-related protein (TIGR01555 family)